ncbi:MAG: retroviral-like aspartic protease family protein [Dysgonomonas sp.]
MNKEGNIYTVPCEVNGLKLRFIFDTGASNVAISMSEANFMLKNGYLESEDIIGSSTVQIADGSIIENTRIIIRSIKIGQLTLDNVEAIVVHNIDAPLLFGQSAIQKLGKIQLQNDKLIILEQSDNDTSSLDVKSVLQNAKDYYKNNHFVSAVELYNKIYDFDKSALLPGDFVDFADASIKTEQYELTVNILEDALKSPIDNEFAQKFTYALYHHYLAKAHFGLKQGDKAISNVEKSTYLSESVKMERIAYENYLLYGDIYLYTFLDYKKAIDRYEKAFKMHYDKTYKNKYKSIEKFGSEMGKGKVKDTYISECFKKLSDCYILSGDKDKFTWAYGLHQKTQK